MQRIAVIVPVYNGEKFLPELINCFLRQTINNFNVYFVDDCSTDNTGIFLQSVVNENASFYYIRNK